MAPCNPNDLVADAPPPNPLLAWLAPCHPFTRPTWANVLLLVTGTLQAPGGHSRAASNTPISPSTTGFWAGRSEAGYDHGPRRARRARPHDFPKEHRAKLHSTNPIERLNGEIKRHTEVVGILPERRSHRAPRRRNPARMGSAAGQIHDAGNDQPDER
jgi:hypothetical protein